MGISAIPTGVIRAMVQCNYCGASAELVSGIVVYPHRPDLYHRQFWRCKPCEAYVSCHDGTTHPMGRLANPELRAAKIRAHAAFDPLWRARGWKRNAAYRWLAHELGIAREACHIGMFDLELCRRVAVVCASARELAQGGREDPVGTRTSGDENATDLTR
jgi:hypothetical protein